MQTRHLCDSQVLTFRALSGLVRVPLEEQLKFGGAEAGGDDEVSHIVQTWVGVVAEMDREKLSEGRRVCVCVSSKVT